MIQINDIPSGFELSNPGLGAAVRYRFTGGCLTASYTDVEGDERDVSGEACIPACGRDFEIWVSGKLGVNEFEVAATLPRMPFEAPYDDLALKHLYTTDLLLPLANTKRLHPTVLERIPAEAVAWLFSDKNRAYGTSKPKLPTVFTSPREIVATLLPGWHPSATNRDVDLVHEMIQHAPPGFSLLRIVGAAHILRKLGHAKEAVDLFHTLDEEALKLFMRIVEWAPSSFDIKPRIGTLLMATLRSDVLRSAFLLEAGPEVMQWLFMSDRYVTSSYDWCFKPSFLERALDPLPDTPMEAIVMTVRALLEHHKFAACTSAQLQELEPKSGTHLRLLEGLNEAAISITQTGAAFRGVEVYRKGNRGEDYEVPTYIMEVTDGNRNVGYVVLDQLLKFEHIITNRDGNGTYLIEPHRKNIGKILDRYRSKMRILKELM